MATLNLGLLPGIAGIFCGSTLLYAALIVLYRLTLHPLARFPGSKWAAATGWYEFYFDVMKRYGGQFAWEIDRMHDVYGPIVRINPDEVHIKDANMYNVIHASNPTHRDKWPPAARMVGTPQSTFGTIDHNLHRERRAANNPLFSNRGIIEAEPLIRGQVQKLCKAIHSIGTSNDVVEMYPVLVAFASETVTLYLLDKDLGLLKDQEKAEEWMGMIRANTGAIPLVKQFPWIMPLVQKIPLPMIRAVNPVLAGSVAFGQYLHDETAAYMADGHHMPEPITDAKDVQAPIFYAAIQKSSLSPSDKTIERVAQEIRVLIGAGGDTTSRIVVNAIFHLLANPEVLARLRKEIMQVMPEIHSAPSVKTLKQLPLLTAVIKETLRVSAILTSRLPLRLPNDFRYKDWVIPAKTPISDTIHNVLLDPDIYPEPRQFRPDRWLESAEKTAKLNHYFVPFSKGTRSCPGMQFAYAEMYMAIPALFRRFEFELYETTRERDIDFWRDCFVGDPHPDSVGVRVRIVKEYT